MDRGHASERKTETSPNPSCALYCSAEKGEDDRWLRSRADDASTLTNDCPNEAVTGARNALVIKIATAMRLMKRPRSGHKIGMLTKTNA